MPSKNVVVQTRLSPPRLSHRILRRPRVNAHLLQALDYRLTIVQAGAGYGKSTALAALSDSGISLAWYHPSREDADPVTFFFHLIYALRPFLLKADALISLMESNTTKVDESSWANILTALINQLASTPKPDIVLVLDDFHLVSGSYQVSHIVDRLLSEAPDNLHFILSTRYPIKLQGLVNLKARGQLLLINQTDLAFTSQEIKALFHEQYSVALSADEVASLETTTEGWAIGLQLFWQGLKGSQSNLLANRMRTDRLSAEELFAFLAQEVMLRLSPDVQNFLQQTAVLREMNSGICDCLRQAVDSKQYLEYLMENGLFVVQVDQNSMRYHHLFREFILNHISKESLISAHKQASQCYLSVGQDEAAVYHLLKAHLEVQAAELIEKLGENLILSGRLETLNSWITSIPPDVLDDFPLLLVFLGDYARLHSRFDEALGWYRQAEQRSRSRGNIHTTSQALHGQAKVFLDTVNPSQAEQLLQTALELVDGRQDRESRAHLLELLAENRLNSGQLAEAEHFRLQARELRELGPGETELSVRVLLRTGRLEQARRILESRVTAERHEPFPTARAHRETLLLLALILVFQGEWESALGYAQEGIARGEMLNSPFVVAVGKMRLGHAALLKNTRSGYEEAVRNFHEAIDIADTLSVPRLKVEALWGLTRAYGFSGDLMLAEKAALKGIEEGRLAGDEWISALILLSMGAGYAIAKDYSTAVTWLERARDKFNKVSDPYGEVLARLWICLVWWYTDKAIQLNRDLPELIKIIHDQDYQFLLTTRTLLGPPQPRQIIPLLLHARRNGIQRAFIETILYSLGLSSIELHPGFQLKVYTLGQFRVLRGENEVLQAEWQREKSRQLFQILLTFHNTPMERDQLVEYLWPEVNPELGRRNFRVALSTLQRVLVPTHQRDEEPVFINRQGSLYALRRNADIWVDAWEFERMIGVASNIPESQSGMRIQQYRAALELYKGDYLQDNLYEDWSIRQREALHSLHIQALNQLARLYRQNRDWNAAIEICQVLLQQDPTWEEAYRLMMEAYEQIGNRPAVLRTYTRCVEELRTELDISPSQATIATFRAIFPNPPLL